jgi:hypothetical protein
MVNRRTFRHPAWSITEHTIIRLGQSQSIPSPGSFRHRQSQNIPSSGLVNHKTFRQQAQADIANHKAFRNLAQSININDGTSF